jgi:hypothetical protein
MIELWDLGMLSLVHRNVCMRVWPAIVYIQVRISLRALRPSVKLTHPSPIKNPLAVAMLASDTLVHPQHVYRDVQTRCNSREHC